MAGRLVISLGGTGNNSTRRVHKRSSQWTLPAIRASMAGLARADTVAWITAARARQLLTMLKVNTRSMVCRARVMGGGVMRCHNGRPWPLTLLPLRYERLQWQDRHEKWLWSMVYIEEVSGSRKVDNFVLDVLRNLSEYMWSFFRLVPWEKGR